MVKIIGGLLVIVGVLSFGCHSGSLKTGGETGGEAGGEAVGTAVGTAGGEASDSTWKDVRGNITFVFPLKGYAYDHRQQLIQACLDGVPEDLRILHLAAFTDSFTIRFLDTRQEMKRYTGYPSGGVALPQPYMIIYYVVNQEEQGPPIKHELMHLITLVDWGGPDPTSVWMNEGLAAYSQNSCNGYTDEQIYRYLAVHNLLLPMDSMEHQFYHTPEMIGYHQGGWMVGYLLKRYGVEKVKDLWQHGVDDSVRIFGVAFSQVEMELKEAAARDIPVAPDIDWKSFMVGCR